jgi:hypothetical protein
MVTGKQNEPIGSQDHAALCEQELQPKFYGLMQDLIRSQNMLNERAMALASLETVEAELNRKRAFGRRVTPPKCRL